MEIVFWFPFAWEWAKPPKIEGTEGHSLLLSLLLPLPIPFSTKYPRSVSFLRQTEVSLELLLWYSCQPINSTSISYSNSYKLMYNQIKILKSKCQINSRKSKTITQNLPTNQNNFKKKKDYVQKDSLVKMLSMMIVALLAHRQRLQLSVSMKNE